MPRIALKPDQSIVCLIDIQARFMAGIAEADRVLNRSLFLAKAAHQLGVPVLGTEQNVDRMGPMQEEFVPYLSFPGIAKMSFSAVECGEFRRKLEDSMRRQVILVGIETHICVSLTALELVQQGFQVVVCPDAVSARSMDRHKLGMERMRDGGVLPVHSEAIAYEWMVTAEHPEFKNVLNHVKSHP
jgi:nicotinamidase-related amidase